MNILPVRKETREGVEFYTVNATGESGMSESGLARLVDTPRKTVTDLLNNLVGGKARSESLKPFTGKDLWLAERGEDNAKIVKDGVCALVIEYYAFDARKTTDAARLAYRKFAQMGIRMWIQEITGWAQPKYQEGQPYWYKRLILYRAKTKIPVGWFSIFEEIIRLVGEIEAYGYILQDGQIPDISVGKCWANHLRSNRINPSDIAMDYKHHYPGWAHYVNANIYPDAYLPMFRKWLEETYKPSKMLAYFKKSAPDALPSICKLLGLPEGK